ncbi:TetR/AcrR family transcriptional regulator [Dyella japonica]|uniref:TetR/AcrR family transcriptional regulator n=1 Tax=Dyella japonica TaxID=231455 RepID=UPI0002F802C4|nr:TetR/AcrR family transcriptional regulator [Dyella japonica]
MSKQGKTDEKPLSERAREQRERILAAAQDCFVRYGFHAASMANIAEAAKMSAGLIYRYFPNKSAIVLAIIERQTEMELEDMRAFDSSMDLTEMLVETFGTWTRPTPDMRIMNAALFLEASAEATRDEAVATAMHQVDQLYFGELQAILTRPAAEGGFGMPAELARQRALVLTCLVEGLAVRAARDPALDPQWLRSALGEAMQHLLAPR